MESWVVFTIQLYWFCQLSFDNLEEHLPYFCTKNWPESLFGPFWEFLLSWSLPLLLPSGRHRCLFSHSWSGFFFSNEKEENSGKNVALDSHNNSCNFHSLRWNCLLGFLPEHFLCLRVIRHGLLEVCLGEDEQIRKSFGSHTGSSSVSSSQSK